MLEQLQMETLTGFMIALFFSETPRWRSRSEPVFLFFSSNDVGLSAIKLWPLLIWQPIQEPLLLKEL